MLPSSLPLANIIDNIQNAGLVTGWNSKQFLAQCVAVTVLFLVLWKFAFKKVLATLEERRKIIEDSMANAEKIKSELAEAEASRLAILQKANEKAAQIVADADKSAVAVAEQRAKEATRTAEDIIKNAHDATVLDRNRLMAELKAQIADLVIQTTQKVTGKVLTADDQARLNRETLAQVDATRN